MFSPHVRTAADDECKAGFGSATMHGEQSFTRAARKTHIMPDMKFKCSGTIAEWNVAAIVRHMGPQPSIALQLWRVQGTNDGTTTYSSATHQIFPVNRPFSTSPTSTLLTLTPSLEMLASSGDVVGFYVRGGPLQILFTDAANFTLYTESSIRMGPITTAIVSESLTASPIISVVFRESFVIYALCFV